MKKILLILFTIIVCLNEIYSQNTAPCPTCNQGKHDGIAEPGYPVNNVLPPDGNSSLGQSYIQQDICGLNYMAYSVKTTTRYNTPAGTGFPTTISVSGLTPCATVLKAFLYWGASYTEVSPPAVTASVTNPVPSTATYSGANIGQSGSVCWGERGTVTYRCDVTASISGNGTYSFNLTGFSNATGEVDGLALIIVYTVPASYSGSISIWDGCVSFAPGAGNLTLGGFNACSASSTASAFALCGDIQSNVNGNANTDNFNGTSQTFSNNFWQINTINPITNLTAGQSTCNFQTYVGNTGDCYTWDVQGLYWQNTNCVSCSASLAVGTTTVSPTCNQSNGSINLSVSGGNSPYTYTWSPNVSTGSSATGLSAGTYTISINDVGSCYTSTLTVTLNSSTLAVSASQTGNILCHGDATASASGTATGGASPYTYSWSGGQTTTNITGLSAGTYTITVTDNNGCAGTASVTITQPAQVTASISSVTNINCNGNSNGSMNATGGGGTSPYSYSWSNGQTSANNTGLSIGTYTITVTDNNGCSATASANITQPTALTSATSAIATSCAASNGSAADTVQGGTPGYTYSWSSGQTTSGVTGLSAGTYTVTATDNNGCTSTSTVTINASTGVNASILSSTNVLCNGVPTGSASAGASGGSSPYTYSWSSGQTTTNISGLSAGTYTINVTDNNGCAGTASVTITQPAPLTVNFDTIGNIQCFGNSSGLIKITAAGGTPGYTYNWSNGNTTTNNTGLSAGSYSITVTDNNGCSVTANATVSQPASALTGSINPIVNVKCANTSTGSATVNASGGTPGYTYNWSNGNTSTSNTGLSAGTYSVTVTDNNGCIFTASVTITQPAKVLKDSIVSTTQIPCHATTGSITVGTIGGTGSYTYSWAPSGGTSTTATGLTAAVYTITVTDSNGCAANVTDTLKPSTTPIPVISGNDSICEGGQVTLTVTGGGTYLWSPGGSTNSSITVSPTSTSTYTVHCTMGTCSADTTFTVIVVPVPSITFSGNTVICKGSSTPWVASGGTSYTWTPNSGLSCNNCPNPTASPTVTTTYTLHVANGNCSKDTTIKMTVVNKPVSFITQNPTGCICKGSCATLTASGGGTYLWLGGSNQVDSVITICPTKDSIYSVQVDKVCKDTAKLPVCIDAPSFIVCCDTTIQIDGSATLSVVYSSSANVTYSWSPSTGLSCTNCPNPVANPTVTTTYTVTMTDSAGCRTANVVTVDIACDDFTMPNIFTPNNDGINDDFVPYYYYNGVMYNGIANLSSYSIKIYDRWGVLVYSSTDPKVYWNGRINGTDNLVPDGTYYYVIDAACQNNTYKKKGFVQVLTGK